MYGRHYPQWVFSLVLLLLAGGGQVPASVFAFGLDERTVVAWQKKVGEHAREVQAALICQGTLELGQVQANELYVKTQCGAVWMATAPCVFSRLFLWGAVGVQRHTGLLHQVVVRVRAATQRGVAILWVTDGDHGWAKAIRQMFRDPLYTDRPALQLWPELQLVQVVKRCTARRQTAIERRLVHGGWQVAQDTLLLTQLSLGAFNIAYIERLKATLRTWMPALTLRSHTPARHRPQLEAVMFLTGCVYNFCRLHDTLVGTPAMAAGLTDSVWSARDLLFHLRSKRDSLHALL